MFSNRPAGTATTSPPSRLGHVVESSLGRVEQKVDGLARSLSEIVGEAVRDAFREERERKR